MKPFNLSSIDWHKVIRSRYTITLLIFLVWIAFFDKTSIQSHMRQSAKNENMREDTLIYNQKISSIDKQIKTLRSNNDSLEKYARERFKMKHDNEEIFLIVKE